MLPINYYAVIVVSILQFIVGALWFSPVLFGKMWAEINEFDMSDPEKVKKVQSEMAPFYGLQLLITFIANFVIAHVVYVFLSYDASTEFYMMAFWLFIGFYIPIYVPAVIWGRTQKKFWTKQLLVTLSNHLVNILLATFVFSHWK